MKLFLLGVVPIIFGAVHIYTSQNDLVDQMKGFCSATHAGEPWPHVAERATKAEMEFFRANASTEKLEEWLVVKQVYSKKWGCRVYLDKNGVVKDSKAAEMKAE
jgi:hypothetical protein